MDKFHIKGSTYIPNIDFDPETRILEIAGESYHEYTTEFYQPVFEWLESFLKETAKTDSDIAQGQRKQVTMNFKMTYFNTSSSRRFIEILSMLEDFSRDNGGNVVVNWYFEENDVDMEESGEEYAEDVDLPFNLIEIPVINASTDESKD